MIEINVAQQLKAPVGFVRTYGVNDMVDITGEGNESMVQGKVKLTKTSRGILVKGTLRTTGEIACSRCLNPFSCPLILDIEDEYFPTIDVFTGVSLRVLDEPGGFTIDEHHILDLTEAIRQYAILAIPMKPLCREDCAGLCSNCGHNLNEGLCNCSPQEKGTLWAKLSKLAIKK